MGTNASTISCGDLVDAQVAGKSMLGTYWYRACTGKHVVFFDDDKGEYARFIDADGVRLAAKAAKGVSRLPGWVR